MNKARNLTSISKKYGQGYVARFLGSNKILAFAKKADSLMEKIKEKKEFKENKLVISWIPKFGQSYAF
jgi:hypothetical protein